MSNYSEKRLPLTRNSTVGVPSSQIPSYRILQAIQDGVEKNILLTTWGGLGDQICSEPTIRYALREFKKSGCQVSLAAEHPELYWHLEGFKDVYVFGKDKIVWENYLVIHTNHPKESLSWEFVNHLITHCVDYHSLAAFRCQLPLADRRLMIRPQGKHFESVQKYFTNDEKIVVVHAGKHWKAKTFPVQWWDEVLMRLISQEFRPLLIGADTDANRGTVDIYPVGCIDLRGKLSLMESIAVTHLARVVLTNDSAPLHMAASGGAWVGFLATVKHPDFLMHYRFGEFGWRMQNLAMGGAWEVTDHCPNRDEINSAGEVDPTPFLPLPNEVADRAMFNHGFPTN
jgi:hypothetical protein